MPPSTYYARIFQDDESTWKFILPLSREELNSRETWLMIKNKLIEFHADYIDISQKYKIAEFYDQGYLSQLQLNFKHYYLNYLKTFYDQEQCLWFLPFPANKKLRPALFSTELAYHDSNGEVVQQAVYDVYDFKSRNEMASSHQFGSSVIDIDSFAGWCFGDDMNKELEEDEILYFTIAIKSELFLPYLTRPDIRDPRIDKNRINNYILAYRNAPRFNSYLRDLKDIFIKKYGWLVQADITESEFVNENGILLYGNIVYQEDIDSGKESVPPHFR